MASIAEERVDAILYPIYLIVVLMVVVGTALAALLLVSGIVMMLVLIGYAIYVAVVTIVTVIVAIVRYNLYRGQEEKYALEQLEALGWTINPDDVFRMAFGVDNLSPRKSADGIDWFEAVVLGVDDDDEE